MKLVTPSLATLCELDSACFSDPYAATIWQQQLERPDRFVLYSFELDTVQVGYACFSVLAPEAELLRIGVIPARRCGGVAAAALALAQRQLRLIGVDRVMLEVRASNIGAIKLYQRLGYINDGRRPNYYPAQANRAPEDALLMSLNLT